MNQPFKTQTFEPFFCNLCPALCIIVLLECKLLISGWLKGDHFKNLCLASSMIHISSSSCWKATPEDDATTFLFLGMNGVTWVLGYVLCQTQHFDLGQRAQYHFAKAFRFCYMPSSRLQACLYNILAFLRSVFLLGNLPLRPDL